MTNKLFLGFKGKNNSSCVLVQKLTDKGYFLTNSFQGLNKDIASIQSDADIVYIFGLDKQLVNEIRIEQSASLEGELLYTRLYLHQISRQLKISGLKHKIVDKPTNSLCNAAYWYALKKFDGKVVFIHIPSLKNMDEDFMQKLKTALTPKEI